MCNTSRYKLGFLVIIMALMKAVLRIFFCMFVSSIEEKHFLVLFFFSSKSFILHRTIFLIKLHIFISWRVVYRSIDVDESFVVVKVVAVVGTVFLTASMEHRLFKDTDRMNKSLVLLVFLWIGGASSFDLVE